MEWQLALSYNTTCFITRVQLDIAHRVAYTSSIPLKSLFNSSEDVSCRHKRTIIFYWAEKVFRTCPCINCFAVFNARKPPFCPAYKRFFKFNHRNRLCSSFLLDFFKTLSFFTSEYTLSFVKTKKVTEARSGEYESLEKTDIEFSFYLSRGASIWAAALLLWRIYSLFYRV